MTLPEVLSSEITLYDENIMPEQIVLGLEHGLFTLIFDGQDEIHKDDEEYYSQMFVSAALKYPKCPIVVTGRPSLEVVSWRDFENFKMLPMTKDKVVQLIENLQFDQMTKLNFIDQLRSGLYETHGEMLSIPLLAIVMLLTFSDTGQISNIFHEFYEDAFAALWRKHDAKKEGFERRHYTDIGRRDFSDLLNAFSASGYVKSTFAFREDEYIRHMKNATKLTSVDVDYDDFKKDLVRSTSLCVMDGLAMKFCHRTFQEYFTAMYILQQSDDAMAKALDAISDRFQTDIVVGFLLSVDDQRVERTWVIPRLREMLNTLGERCRDPEYYFLALRTKELSKLSWLRDYYGLEPNSADLYAAQDARNQMIRSFGSAIVRVENDGDFNELVSADINGLRRLLESLEQQELDYSEARREVFGDI